jgi:predicted metalloprotease with PDZ domain
MPRVLLALLLLAPALLSAQGVGTVAYDIRFPNAVQREAEVSIRYEALPATPLRVRMSRSSPGRYALHEFAKNVYNGARRGRERPAAPDRAHLSARLARAGHRGTVVFSYTLYADRADGTYAGIDATRAHLNMPATFAWAPRSPTGPSR